MNKWFLTLSLTDKFRKVPNGTQGALQKENGNVCEPSLSREICRASEML